MTRKLTTALLAMGMLSLAACSGSEDGDKPVISSFTGTPAMVRAGESTTLSWAVTGVETVSINITAGATSVTTSTDLSGNVEFTVQETTTFTLVATSGGETAMATTTVTVRVINPDELAILSFTATPNPAPAGGMTTLAWNTQNATSIKVSEGATELYSGTDDTGTVQATLTAASHTYTIEITDGTDTETDSVTVTTEAAGAITTFTATPMSFTGASQDVVLTWDATGATFTLTANGTDVPGFSGNGSGTQTVNVSDTTTFSFSAIGGGSTDTQDIVVTKTIGESEPNNDRATATPITGGVTAAITPADLDYYSFSVVEGGYVIAETSDGMGGCPGDTVIELWDTAGVDFLGRDDDGGEGTCSLIDGRDDAFARELPAGTYYIAVRAFSDTSSIAAYTLSLQTGAPGCGNGIQEADEQCDDGNTTAGDGCDASCAFEVDGSVTTMGTLETFNGMLVEDGRLVYAVTVAADGFIRAESGVPALGQCEAGAGGGRDTIIQITTSTGAVVDRDDDGGLGLCSLAFGNVRAGSYFVEVIELGQDAVIPAIQVSIGVFPQGCGNYVVEAGEQCDDGNTTAGDGCSATCTYDPATTIAAPGGTASGTLLREGLPNTVLAAVTVGEGNTVTATTSACTFPNGIGLVSVDMAGAVTVLGGNFAEAPEQCSGIFDTFATNLTAGTYYLIGTGQAAATGAVSVDVTVGPPACGNRVTEGMEQCDDGNTTPGDGCDASCNVEGLTSEVEPNDTLANATAIPGAMGTGFGVINPVGDLDYYAVTVAAGQGITATTYTAAGDPTTCSGADTLIELRDSTDTLLVDDDDDGPGLCSSLDPTTDMAAGMLAAGTYYIVVRVADHVR